VAEGEPTVLDPRFPGGITPAEHKAETAERPIRRIPLPEVLHVPLKQHIGNPARAVVRPGHRVRKGDVLARPDGYHSVAVHAPTSGVIAALGDHPAPHPSGLAAPAVTLEADGADQWTDLAPRPDYEDLRPAEVRALIRQAGLVGLGGAGFPTFIKLNPGPWRPVDTLVLNGAESEAYLTCDDRLMRERPEEILAGGRIMAFVLGARRIVVAVESNKPNAASTIREAAAGWDEIETAVVASHYPMGSEKQLILTLTGREVPSGGLPADVGVVNQNVGTAAAVYRAVVRGEPLVDRVVTVAGSALVEPANLEVPIGTPIEAVAAACGGYRDLGRLILGGPLMGPALHTTAAPVVKESNGLVFQRREEVAQEPAMPCIRCGACVEACPVGLMPSELYHHARNRELDKAQEYDLFDCIECGSCAWVCPSRLPLVDYYRFAKSEIQRREREGEEAAVARRRTEAREARLRREQEEKEAARRAKKEQAHPEGSSDPREEAARRAAERRRARRGRTQADPGREGPGEGAE